MGCKITQRPGLLGGHQVRDGWMAGGPDTQYLTQAKDSLEHFLIQDMRPTLPDTESSIWTQPGATRLGPKDVYSYQVALCICSVHLSPFSTQIPRPGFCLQQGILSSLLTSEPLAPGLGGRLSAIPTCHHRDELHTQPMAPASFSHGLCFVQHVDFKSHDLNSLN